MSIQLTREEVIELEEIWGKVIDFSNYEVSTLGRVRNVNTKDIKSTWKDNDGYVKVSLIKIGPNKKTYRKTVHRLVAETFLGGKHDHLQVNHKNGLKDDNRVSNLEWVTGSQNVLHAYSTGIRKPSGGRGPIRPVRVVETGLVYDNLHECAKAIDSDSGNVSRCLHGEFDSIKGFHLEYADADKTKKKPFLFDYQMDAVKRMFNGCILNGSVGSGKSRTGLYYFFSQCGGSIDPDYVPMTNPKDLYIITTAMKRDKLEWEGELLPYLINKDPLLSLYGDEMAVTIDSWNNIAKYKDVNDAFFIFDEDRVTGNGVWVKSFLKIAKANEWIILSATSGDTWTDYIPVFIANGFYKNRTDFTRQHIIYSRFTKYPKIDRYVDTGRLIRLRNKLLIDMDFKRKTIAHHQDIYVNYDLQLYKEVMKTRTDPFKQCYVPCRYDDPSALEIGKDISIAEIDNNCGWGYTPQEGDTVKLINEPIINASGLCYTLRRIVNMDESRQVALLEILEEHPRVIIFYNFDHELDLLLDLAYSHAIEVAQWNGHAHNPIPDSDRWVYLVQYTAGCEGWNSIKTDTIVFYSQNYSYKVMTQAAGRIDRLNTPYRDLYYYHLKSRSGIDLAISKALKDKKKFNESRWVKW